MSIKVTLKKISNHGPKQKAIAEQACLFLEKALNHPNFRQMVESEHYRETRFRDHEGRAFSVAVNEVYNYIASGSERGTSEDAEIDIEVALKDLGSGTLGATTPGKLPFHTAYWFIKQCISRNDPVSLARHFIHEWLHVSGFYHYPNNKARKDVPYNVGDVVKAILLGDSKARTEDSDPSSPAYALEHGDCGASQQNLAHDIDSGNREDLHM